MHTATTHALNRVQILFVHFHINSLSRFSHSISYLDGIDLTFVRCLAWVLLIFLIFFQRNTLARFAFDLYFFESIKQIAKLRNRPNWNYDENKKKMYVFDIFFWKWIPWLRLMFWVQPCLFWVVCQILIGLTLARCFFLRFCFMWASWKQTNRRDNKKSIWLQNKTNEPTDWPLSIVMIYLHKFRGKMKFSTERKKSQAKRPTESSFEKCPESKESKIALDFFKPHEFIIIQIMICLIGRNSIGHRYVIYRSYIIDIDKGWTAYPFSLFNQIGPWVISNWLWTVDQPMTLGPPIVHHLADSRSFRSPIHQSIKDIVIVWARAHTQNSIPL